MMALSVVRCQSTVFVPMMGDTVSAYRKRSLVARLGAGLPDYQGGVKRRTTLPKDRLAKYKKGAIVMEEAFTSTSAEGPVSSRPEG